jgi:hypothetical protein
MASSRCDFAVKVFFLKISAFLQIRARMWALCVKMLLTVKSLLLNRSSTPCYITKLSLGPHYRAVHLCEFRMAMVLTTNCVVLPRRIVVILR